MEQIGPHTKGVYIISVTPFTDQGDIDWKSIDSLVEFYIANGVSGVTILGMMGEAQKLAETESTAFAKYFIDRVAGRVPVVGELTLSHQTFSRSHRAALGQWP